jgi:hypothetical protein
MNTSALIRRFLTAATLAPLCIAGIATAEEIKLTLSGGMEVPSVATMATGSGSIVVNPDGTLSGGIATTGIDATAAHIHVGKAGVNGPVAVGLIKSGGDAWRVPEGAKLDASQLQAYTEGALYVNVHSAAHKAGEIRGQLMPAILLK